MIEGNYLYKYILLIYTANEICDDKCPDFLCNFEIEFFTQGLKPILNHNIHFKQSNVSVKLKLNCKF